MDNILFWDVSPDTTVTEYDIGRAVDPGGQVMPPPGTFSIIDTVTGRLNNTYTDTGGTATSWYRVRAVSPAGDGEWSVPFRAWEIAAADTCVVFGVLFGTDGKPAEDAEVLIAASKGSLYITGQQFQIGMLNAMPIRTNENGQWAAVMVRTSKMTPSGSHYVFEFRDSQGRPLQDPGKKTVPDQESANYNQLPAV